MIRFCAGFEEFVMVGTKRFELPTPLLPKQAHYRTAHAPTLALITSKGSDSGLCAESPTGFGLEVFEAGATEAVRADSEVALS